MQGVAPIVTQAVQSSSLQTVNRALQVLDLFTTRSPEWGATEVAERLGISKSMAYRLLITLSEHGFLQQDPKSKRYRLGLRLLGLGSLVGDQLEVRRIALPIMESLAHSVGETVFLTVPHQRWAVAVARVEAGPAVHWLMGIGERFPLTSGASNKVLLAFMDPAVQQEVIAAAVAEEQVDVDQLRAELARIRAQGYAFSVGEVTYQTAAVAVPILSGTGQLVGGLSVAGPSGRITPERAPDLAVATQDATIAIARHCPTTPCR